MLVFISVFVHKMNSLTQANTRAIEISASIPSLVTAIVNIVTYCAAAGPWFANDYEKVFFGVNICILIITFAVLLLVGVASVIDSCYLVGVALEKKLLVQADDSSTQKNAKIVIQIANGIAIFGLLIAVLLAAGSAAIATDVVKGNAEDASSFF